MPCTIPPVMESSRESVTSIIIFRARAVIQRVKTCDFDVEVLDLISLYIT